MYQLDATVLRTMYVMTGRYSRVRDSDRRAIPAIDVRLSSGSNRNVHVKSVYRWFYDWIGRADYRGSGTIKEIANLPEYCMLIRDQ
jgi:hypothetical protein